MTGPEHQRDQPARQPASDLLPQVYKQLRDLARHRIRQENPAHTLQATALVHEAYLRVANGDGFANRAHFFKAAAEAMRRILVDHARAKATDKRGGGRRAVELTSNVLDLAAVPDSEQILALDDAIARLEGQSPVAAAVVRLRFYAGLSVDETAETLDVSPRSVNREWTFARAWLFRELDEQG
jgi:RNA polymerase sigma factor (TIGR02999 family)